MSKNQMFKQTRCFFVLQGSFGSRGSPHGDKPSCSPSAHQSTSGTLLLASNSSWLKKVQRALEPRPIRHHRPYLIPQVGPYPTDRPAGRPSPFMASQTNERASSDACDPENSTCSSWVRRSCTAADFESPTVGWWPKSLCMFNILWGAHHPIVYCNCMLKQLFLSFSLERDSWDSCLDITQHAMHRGVHVAVFKTVTTALDSIRRSLTPPVSKHKQFQSQGLKLIMTD